MKKACDTCNYALGDNCQVPRKYQTKEWEEWYNEASIRSEIYPDSDCPSWRVDRVLLDKCRFLNSILEV